MKPHDRLDYSAIAHRRPLKLPGGARMIVSPIVAVEEWDIDRPMPRTVVSPPAGGAPPSPDIPNWAWHEYGNRVGFWRLLEIFDDLKVKSALAINGCAIEAYKPISEAARDRGWEFLAHGYTQLNMQKVADEAADIARTTEAIRSFTGKQPLGWVGPGLTETWNTPDILADNGYGYVLDWVIDDQPVPLKVSSGKPFVAMPYTQECNDLAIIIAQQHRAAEFYERGVDQFEQLYHDGRNGARVMAFSVHPYIMGAPHRAKYVRKLLEHMKARHDVLFWTGAEILEWYRSQG